MAKSIKPVCDWTDDELVRYWKQIKEAHGSFRLDGKPQPSSMAEALEEVRKDLESVLRQSLRTSASLRPHKIEVIIDYCLHVLMRGELQHRIRNGIIDQTIVEDK